MHYKQSIDYRIRKIYMNKDNCMRIDLREFVKDGFTEIFAVSEIEKILNIISTYIVHGGL